MARTNRVIIPGLPHHITQRGNRRADVFRDEEDRTVFLRLLHNNSLRYGLKHWAYCLMSNHFHLISVPDGANSLSCTLRDLLGPYANYFNQKYGLTGRLWQGRFYSCVLEEGHLGAALRYVERNPIRAGWVGKAENYPWSSAAAHCGLRDEPLLTPFYVNPYLIPNWSDWLCDGESEAALKQIREKTKTGRPLGSDAFIDQLENLLGRPLRPRKGGRPPQQKPGNG